MVGADSLGYLSLDGLVQAIGLPERKLCNACFHGRYPMPIDGLLEKLGLERVAHVSYAAAGVDLAAAEENVRRIGRARALDARAAGAGRLRRLCRAVSPAPTCATRCWSPAPTASAPRCCSGWSCGGYDVLGPRPGQPVGQRRADDRRAAAVLPRLRGRARDRPRGHGGAGRRHGRGLSRQRLRAARRRDRAVAGPVRAGPLSTWPARSSAWSSATQHHRRLARARGRSGLGLAVDWACTPTASAWRARSCAGCDLDAGSGRSLGQSLGEALLAAAPVLPARGRSRC